MPILFACPNGHSLRVKDKLAGKQGKCPTCGADFDVPALPTPPIEGGPPPEPVPTGPAAAPPLPSGDEPAVEWRMARSSGEQFGPTVPAVFAQWIEAGRVTPDTLVSRTGWPDWRRADAANADLPAELPSPQNGPPPLPVPGMTLPPPLTPTPAEAPTPLPASKPSRPTPPASAYLLRKRQQAKRRRMITVALALVCVALAGMLAVMMSGGEPESESPAPTPAPPQDAAADPGV